jgi:hypothetical protein
MEQRFVRKPVQLMPPPARDERGEKPYAAVQGGCIELFETVLLIQLIQELRDPHMDVGQIDVDKANSGRCYIACPGRAEVEKNGNLLIPEGGPHRLRIKIRRAERKQGILSGYKFRPEFTKLNLVLR